MQTPTEETQFNDADMAKLNGGVQNTPTPEEDDMFEDLFQEDNQDDSVGEGEAGQESEGGEEQDKGTDNQPSQEDYDENQGGGSQDFSEYGDDMSDEVKEILDSIQVSEDAQTNAQNDLSEAINNGSIEEQNQALQALIEANNEKDRRIGELMNQIAIERNHSDRLLDENLLSQTQNREIQKVYEAVSDNPLLKDIAVYMMNNEGGRYDDKLKEATKQLFEEINGVSIDELLEQNKRNEKIGMGENTYEFEGKTPDKSYLGGMLEDL